MFLWQRDTINGLSTLLVQIEPSTPLDCQETPWSRGGGWRVPWTQVRAQA